MSMNSLVKHFLAYNQPQVTQQEDKCIIIQWVQNGND